MCIDATADIHRYWRGGSLDEAVTEIRYLDVVLPARSLVVVLVD